MSYILLLRQTAVVVYLFSPNVEIKVLEQQGGEREREGQSATAEAAMYRYIITTGGGGSGNVHTQCCNI